MRYAAIAVLAAIAVPAQALWVEVDTLEAPCRAAGINVTFNTGDFLPDGRNGWVAGTYRAEGGERIAILRTTDGRRSWNVTWTDISGAPARAISFVDANHGWLLAGSQEIYRTEDGGRTWLREEIIGGSWLLRNLQMIDATHGFASGAVFDRRAITIMAYDAADRSWEQIGFDPPGSLLGLAARAPFRVWAAGLTVEGTHIARRWREGDARWEAMSIPSSVRALSFVSDTRGYAACTAGRVFETSNGGASWREKITPVLSDLTDLRFTSHAEGVALSEQGNLLLVTTNRGDSWAVERTPDGAHTLLWDGTNHLVLTTTGLYQRQEITRVGPIVVERPQLARVLDLAIALPEEHTWRDATELDEPFPENAFRGRGLRRVTGACFLDDGRHGWITGVEARNIRAVLRTTNGGLTWELLDRTGLPETIRGLHFVDANNGWAFGSGPFFVRTRDGGQTWEPETLVSAPPTGVITQFEMFDANRGMAVLHVDGAANDALIERSAADGRWRQVGAVTPFSKLATHPSGLFWVGVSPGRLEAGSDPDSLTTIQSEMLPHTFRKLMLHDSRNGWALFVRSTQLQRTTNGGEDWQQMMIDHDPANYVVDGALAGRDHCYVLTRLGRVMETRDGGAEWDTLHDLGEPIDPEWSSIHLFDDHLYVFTPGQCWTTVPAREPAEIRDIGELRRPVMADRLLSWSEESAWGGDGVSHSPGRIGQEAVFRVRWDPRNSKSPGRLMLQMRLPASAGAIPLLARLRPADWWATHETGTGDWGVGFTPSIAGRYEYRFFGTNEDGEEVVGEPTEWSTWTVE